MSELNIKINIPARGKTVGTLAWLKDELENIELNVTSCDGNPAISYKLKDDKESIILLFKGDNTNNQCLSPYNYNRDYDYSVLYSEKCECNEPDFECYMFEYLTASAREYLRDLFNKIMGELETYLADEEVVKDIDADVKLTFISK